MTKAFAAPASGTLACVGGAGLDPGALIVRRAGGTAAPTGNASCLASRASVGARRLGRLALGVRRARLLVAPSLAEITRPAVRSGWYRYCVKGSRRGVAVVFGRGTKAELIASTAKGHRLRGLGPGSSSRAVRRALPARRAVGAGVYRISSRSQRIIGVRKGRVTFVGVASRRVLARRALVRATVKRAGL